MAQKVAEIFQTKWKKILWQYIFRNISAPPKIHLPSRFKETCTFEKGEPIVMKIPFTGNPKPTVKWTKDGEELSGRNFTQEVTDRHAILTVKEANKDGGGPYHLKLENDLGSDSATINIQVNGQCSEF